MASSKRTSEYFRGGRTSINVVQETRGVPLKATSILFGVVFLHLGARFAFNCGKAFTTSPVELKMAAMATRVFGEKCEADPEMRMFVETIGVMCFLNAMIRFRVAFTEKVAELYHMMVVVCAFDAMILVMYLKKGLGLFLWIYPLLVISMCAYEAWVLVVARKAYLAREKMKYAQD